MFTFFLDERPEFTCGFCNNKWTEGNPYSEHGSEDRLKNLATY